MFNFRIYISLRSAHNVQVHITHKIKKHMGRYKKFASKEEEIAARQKAQREYYHRNREERNDKNKERYKNVYSPKAPKTSNNILTSSKPEPFELTPVVSPTPLANAPAPTPFQSLIENKKATYNDIMDCTGGVESIIYPLSASIGDVINEKPSYILTASFVPDAGPMDSYHFLYLPIKPLEYINLNNLDNWGRNHMTMSMIDMMNMTEDERKQFDNKIKQEAIKIREMEISKSLA